MYDYFDPPLSLFPSGKDIPLIPIPYRYFSDSVVMVVPWVQKMIIPSLALVHDRDLVRELRPSLHPMESDQML